MKREGLFLTETINKIDIKINETEQYIKNNIMNQKDWGEGTQREAAVSEKVSAVHAILDIVKNHVQYDDKNAKEGFFKKLFKSKSKDPKVKEEFEKNRDLYITQFYDALKNTKFS